MLILNWESSNTTYDFKRKKEVAAEVWEVTNPDVRVKVDNTIPIFIGVCVVIIIIIISICCCKKKGERKKRRLLASDISSKCFVLFLLRLLSWKLVHLVELTKEELLVLKKACSY